MSVSSMNNTNSISGSITKAATQVGDKVKNLATDNLNEVPQVLYGPAPASPNDMVEELDIDFDFDNIDINKVNETIEKYKGREISSLTNEEFIDLISSYAQIEYTETGILPSIVIALAINESNWGNNCKGNNLFGLTAGDSWEGETLIIPSKSNKQAYKLRYYDSIDQGIKDYYELLTGDRYKPFVDACKNNDVTGACKALKECGYTTSTSFENRILEIMIDNNLGQYNP